MKKRTTLLAVLCALALGIAACGDDDEGNGALSYEDTGAEISAICEKYDTDEDEEKLTGKAASDAEVWGQMIAKIEDALQEMRDLEVHEELAADRDRFVGLGEEALEDGRTVQEAAETGQRDYDAAIEDAGAGAEVRNRESDELASRLGASACVD